MVVNIAQVLFEKLTNFYAETSPIILCVPYRVVTWQVSWKILRVWRNIVIEIYWNYKVQQYFTVQQYFKEFLTGILQLSENQ